MSLLYQFVKYSGRLALPFFFGKLEINGRVNIPRDQPFIIAPNHQSAFLDAILMGVYNEKAVHFLTRSDVFVHPFIGALEALNMMPVYRIRDGYEKLSKNEEIFAKCQALLAKGEPVLIFPEGNMAQGHFLRPLTKGTSRLAFQTQREIKEELFVLPVGINYFHHYRPRYKCIINFGKPISVKAIMDMPHESKAKALIYLRNELSDSIKDLLVIPEKEDYDKKKLYLNYRNENLSFAELKKNIQNGTAKLAHFKTSLAWLPKLLTFINILPIGVVSHILSNVITERQFTSSLKYTLGLILTVIWNILIFIASTLFFGLPWACIAVFVSLASLIGRSELKKRTDPI